MDKLIFLLLFNGLHGYVLQDMPKNPKDHPLSNVEIEYNANQDKLKLEFIGGNNYINPAYNNNDETTTPANADEGTMDKWSVVWYMASFGGLIAFFLIVSCSEWCCRRNARVMSRTNSQTDSAPVTPPPSYDQFAPPAYESLNCNSNGEKSEFDIYVVPVHALGTILSSPRERDDEPPSYLVASDRQLPSPSLSPPGQITPNVL